MSGGYGIGLKSRAKVAKGQASAGVSVSLGFNQGNLQKELQEENWWEVFSSAAVIFVGASAFFLFSTLSRAAYFFDPWTGTVVIAGTFVIAYAVMSLAVSRGVTPIFDYPMLILNSNFLGMRSHPKRFEQSIGGEIHWIAGLVYLLALFCATFLGNGLARAVVGDETYAMAVKTIPFYSSANRAFFIEWAVQSIQFITLQQLPQYGSNLEWTAIINGFFMLSAQAVGIGISGASYNTIYWLGLNIIGTDIKENVFSAPVAWWDHNSWVVPVSTVVAMFTAMIVGYALSYARRNAERFKNPRYDAIQQDAPESDEERDED